jgi:ZIP family zinc transporter
VIEAFWWGALAASTLLLGAVIVYRYKPGQRLIASVLAVGSGLLIGSVAFKLVDVALKTETVGWVGLLVSAGAATFAGGDLLLDRRGASKRKDPNGGQAEGSPPAIVLGSVLDGIPESFVLGLTVLQGSISVALLFGVGLSNLPEGISSSSGLEKAGWPRRGVFLMWLLVALISALSAAIGYGLLDAASIRTGALAQGFASGALLAMLADTMLPETYAVESAVTGLLVVAGFAVSIALGAI